MPILHAPILEQAGFSLGSSNIVKNYIYKLDGSNKYINFSDPLLLTSDCEISLDVILGSNTTQVIYGDGSSPERFYIGTENGNWLVGNGTDRVDTMSPADISVINETVVTLSGGVFKLTVNSVVVYEQPIKYSTAKDLDGISTLSGFRMLGSAFNFTLSKSDTVTNSIPLTNKAQGATQLPTVGSVSATIVGYNENDWEEV